MTSLWRPSSQRRPTSSIHPTSPVSSHPSSLKTAAVSFGRPQYCCMTCGPRVSTLPSLNNPPLLSTFSPVSAKLCSLTFIFSSICGAGRPTQMPPSWPDKSWSSMGVKDMDEHASVIPAPWQGNGIRILRMIGYGNEIPECVQLNQDNLRSLSS